jgi:hypothetical protein
LRKWILYCFQQFLIDNQFDLLLDLSGKQQKETSKSETKIQFIKEILKAGGIYSFFQ